jgi:hypothetical protein
MTTTARRVFPFAVVLALALIAVPIAALRVVLPNAEGSLKFAVIGDGGTGGSGQAAVGQQMFEAHKAFPYGLVLMLGDNLYGRERPRDYERKFERPYKPLLDAGVKFYAALGNHDEREQRFYKHFNMGGQTYYSFKASGQSVRFFALESDYMDRKQLDWIEEELRRSNDAWKIVFMHHPLYSSGRRHGSSVGLREALEPLFLKYGVSLVLAGHEHFYERLQPQNGIHYITQGAAGKLRRGNIRNNTGKTAVGFDTDLSFTIMEIDGDELHFQTISRRGETVDAGMILRREVKRETAGFSPSRSVRPRSRPAAPFSRLR